MIDNNNIDELTKKLGLIDELVEKVGAIEEAIQKKRITKAEIMAVEDDNERMKLIAENRDLF